MGIDTTILDIINVVIVNTVLGLISVNANNTLLVQNKWVGIGIIALLHCISVFYIVFKHFRESLFDHF